MKKIRCNLRSAMLVFAAAFFFTSCSGLFASIPGKRPGPEDLEAMSEAQRILSVLSDQNQMLKNFKGIGRIKIWQNEKLQIDERIAWIGSTPAKLSFVVLVSGYPVIKAASDGEYFYYYEARNGQPLYRKVSAADASLKRILSIEIKTSDIMHLLTGRVPLREHTSASLSMDNSGSGYVLALKKSWWGVIEKIFLDENKTRVHQIDFFSRTGALVYRARFEEMQMIQGYQVPSILSISNDEGSNFQLDVDEYWADVHVSPSMFVLNPPD